MVVGVVAVVVSKFSTHACNRCTFQGSKLNLLKVKTYFATWQVIKNVGGFKGFSSKFWVSRISKSLKRVLQDFTWSYIHVYPIPDQPILPPQSASKLVYLGRAQNLFCKYYLAKFEYFTNLDFAEINGFPFLSCILGWGRVRSLQFDQTYNWFLGPCLTLK